MKNTSESKKRLWIIGLALLCLAILVQVFVVMPAARQSAGLGGHGTSQELNATLRADSGNVAAHRRLADHYLAQRNYPELVKQWQEIVRIEPNDDYNSLMLASALRKAGRKAEAVEMFKKLAEQDDEAGRAAKKALARIESSP